MLNLSAEDSNGTPNSELPVAEICTLPSCFLNPRLGDVVWVAFENGEEGKPVVIGYMQGEYNTETTVDLTVGTLTINGQVKLPATTTIGSVTSESIQSLYGVSENLQDQVNTLQVIIDQLVAPQDIIIDQDSAVKLVPTKLKYNRVGDQKEDYDFFSYLDMVEHEGTVYENTERLFLMDYTDEITLNKGFIIDSNDWKEYFLTLGVISGQIKSYTSRDAPTSDEDKFKIQTNLVDPTLSHYTEYWNYSDFANIVNLGKDNEEVNADGGQMPALFDTVKPPNLHFHIVFQISCAPSYFLDGAKIWEEYSNIPSGCTVSPIYLKSIDDVVQVLFDVDVVSYPQQETQIEGEEVRYYYENAEFPLNICWKIGNGAVSP